MGILVGLITLSLPWSLDITQTIILIRQQVAKSQV